MALTKVYRVFCDHQLQYTGNTSAVVLLNTPLAESKMQQIAADLCQPATTFLNPLLGKNAFGVRWFAPDEEIPVCGHGAAAAIAFLAQYYDTAETFKVHYSTGYLTGKSESPHQLQITLPAFRVLEEVSVSEYLKKGLGIPVEAHFKTENKNIVLVASEADVQAMKPDFETLRKDGSFGYIVTAAGNTADFVSRTIVPHVTQLEDPATGSSHATLTPFWAERLGKTHLTAHQLSKRGGKFLCELTGDQSILTGAFKLVMEGELLFE